MGGMSWGMEKTNAGMRRRIGVALAVVTVGLVLVPCAVSAQDTGFERAVLAASGAGDISELSEGEIERYADYLRRPVLVNVDGRTRMEGLLDAWRAAAIVDYRERCGEIGSWTELASIDGLDMRLVEALRPFLSLDPGSTRPGMPRSSTAVGETDILLRGSFRGDEGGAPDYNYAAKFRYARAGRYSAGITFKRLFDAGTPAPGTFGVSVELCGRRRPVRLVLGDFHARFGQGLVLWSGFSMSGFGTVEAFRRKQTGIRAAWTLSPDYALRGAALECGTDAGLLSALLTTDGMLAANLRRLGRCHGVGATAYVTLVPDGNGRREGMASVDFRWSPGRRMRRCELFAETGWDLSAGKMACTGGVMWTPAYGRRYALMLRSHPDGLHASYAGPPRSYSRYGDEAGVAGGCSLVSSRGFAFSATVDWALHPADGSMQLKSVADFALPIMGWMALKPRMTWRRRESDEHRDRIDMRVDADLSAGSWSGRVRAEAVSCEGLSRLYYAEAGFAGKTLSAHARLTAFAADRWNDRIYCYERDVAGMFTVPAYYGRGTAFHLLCSVRLGRGRVGVRGSYVHYSAGPFKSGRRTDKPDRAELRLQYVATL